MGNCLSIREKKLIVPEDENQKSFVTGRIQGLNSKIDNGRNIKARSFADISKPEPLVILNPNNA
jgi:hypothetical protein